MIDVPIAYAFSAGMLATVNPCGFVMLPAYLSYLLGVDNATTPERPIGRAIAVSTTMAAGFLVVFAVAGTLVSAGIRFFIDYVPWAAIGIGALLIVLGGAVMLGRPLKVRLPHIDSGVARNDRSVRRWMLFGISYATVSLSCTLPVFLTVVAAPPPRPTSPLVPLRSSHTDSAWLQS
ncbi:MAG: cytochrome c biogenesis CcdA family protein [Actinomycetota bacterium]